MLIRAAGKLVFACVACALALVPLVLWTGTAQALSLQTVGSFEEPIFVTSDPGNPDRLFVVERQGSIVLLENGVATTFADIHTLVASGGEEGLLSIALSPDFDQSGRFYLDYAGKEEVGEEEKVPADIHVAEMRAVGGSASIATLRNLLTIPHPDDVNHYGGQIQFGPEGDLFASTGDGGCCNDVHHHAQNLGSLLGKILRIDPNPSGLSPYTIPASNPFVGKAGSDEIWAYGLRNPFRFSFDRLTGALTIGDVGQDAREEVDYAPAPGLGAGANYGWNCREGFIEGPADDEGCSTAPPGAFTEPIFDYPHTDPEDGSAHGCAIIGGYVARGPGLGDVYGRYVYGDLCTGEIRSLLPALPFASGDRSEGQTVDNLNSFGEDSCGRLYAISGNGPVYRLVGPGGTACPSSQPAPSPSASFVGIRTERRQVKRRKRALISAWVAPCKGRAGQPVSLWRGHTRIGVRHLDRVCTVHFRPRITRRTSFRAKVTSDGVYAEAVSRRLKIRILHKRKRR